MQLFYTIVLYLVSPFVILRLFWLGRKNPDYRRRWTERFGLVSHISITRPVLWIHAVSVGEVHATKPLVKALRSACPQYQIVMTTVTPTGAFSVRQSYEDSVEHIYFPYDLPFAIRRFLNQVRPKLLIVMETELWPNLLTICQQQDIPVLLVNARLSERSCRGYRRVRSLTGRALKSLSVIAAQSQLDADRFLSLGASKNSVSVTGNLKFDINLPPSIVEQAESQRRYFSVDRPVWIAASTHEGEEELVLQAFEQILRFHERCLLIIAPRHPERFDLVHDLCIKQDLITARRTESENYNRDTKVFVLDTLGELPMFYACSDVALVGGSLIPGIGGHNMLEPASLGVPVISGEHLFNFVEVSTLLRKEDAVAFVSDHEQLALKVMEFLRDANLRHGIGEKAKQVVMENRGATRNLMNVIQKYL